MHRSSRMRLLAAIGIAATASGAFFAAAAPAGAGPKARPLDREALAKALLAHHSQYISAQTQRMIAHVAGLDQFGPSPTTKRTRGRRTRARRLRRRSTAPAPTG